MTDLIETIRISDGSYHDLDSHMNRMLESSLEAFGEKVIMAKDLLRIPEDMRSGTVKCRIRYNTQIENITFSHYSPRTIGSLRLVQCEGIDYHLKYADRSIFDELSKMKAGCDEILVVRNGFITDTSFSNVAFSREGKLFVPDTFLLNGCMRQKLLREGKAAAIPVRPADIHLFEKVFLINAMLDPGITGISTSYIFQESISSETANLA